MHKDKQQDMTRTTSLIHIHQPPTQVTAVVQHRGRAAGPAGLAELIRPEVLHASPVSCLDFLWQKLDGKPRSVASSIFTTAGG